MKMNAIINITKSQLTAFHSSVNPSSDDGTSGFDILDDSDDDLSIEKLNMTLDESNGELDEFEQNVSDPFGDETENSESSSNIQIFQADIAREVQPERRMRPTLFLKKSRSMGDVFHPQLEGRRKKATNNASRRVRVDSVGKKDIYGQLQSVFSSPGSTTRKIPSEMAEDIMPDKSPMTPRDQVEEKESSHMKDCDLSPLFCPEIEQGVLKFKKSVEKSCADDSNNARSFEDKNAERTREEKSELLESVSSEDDNVQGAMQLSQHLEEEKVKQSPYGKGSQLIDGYRSVSSCAKQTVVSTKSAPEVRENRPERRRRRRSKEAVLAGDSQPSKSQSKAQQELKLLEEKFRSLRRKPAGSRRMPRGRSRSDESCPINSTEEATSDRATSVLSVDDSAKDKNSRSLSRDRTSRRSRERKSSHPNQNAHLRESLSKSRSVPELFPDDDAEVENSLLARAENARLRARRDHALESSPSKPSSKRRSLMNLENPEGVENPVPTTSPKKGMSLVDFGDAHSPRPKSLSLRDELRNELSISNSGKSNGATKSSGKDSNGLRRSNHGSSDDLRESNHRISNDLQRSNHRTRGNSDDLRRSNHRTRGSSDDLRRSNHGSSNDLRRSNHRTRGSSNDLRRSNHGSSNDLRRSKYGSSNDLRRSNHRTRGSSDDLRRSNHGGSKDPRRTIKGSKNDLMGSNHNRRSDSLESHKNRRSNTKKSLDLDSAALAAVRRRSLSRGRRPDPPTQTERTTFGQIRNRRQWRKARSTEDLFKVSGADMMALADEKQYVGYHNINGMGRVASNEDLHVMENTGYCAAGKPNILLAAMEKRDGLDTPMTYLNRGDVNGGSVQQSTDLEAANYLRGRNQRPRSQNSEMPSRFDSYGAQISFPAAGTVVVCNDVDETSEMTVSTISLTDESSKRASLLKTNQKAKKMEDRKGSKSKIRRRSSRDELNSTDHIGSKIRPREFGLSRNAKTGRRMRSRAAMMDDVRKASSVNSFDNQDLNGSSSSALSFAFDEYEEDKDADDGSDAENTAKVLKKEVARLQALVQAQEEEEELLRNEISTLRDGIKVRRDNRPTLTSTALPGKKLAQTVDKMKRTSEKKLEQLKNAPGLKMRSMRNLFGGLTTNQKDDDDSDEGSIRNESQLENSKETGQKQQVQKGVDGTEADPPSRNVPPGKKMRSMRNLFGGLNSNKKDDDDSDAGRIQQGDVPSSKLTESKRHKQQVQTKFDGTEMEQLVRNATFLSMQNSKGENLYKI